MRVVDPVPVTVADAPQESRYEAHAGEDLVGVVMYELRPGEIEFIHTEVLQQGLGVGGTLARGALDDCRARGLPVVPTCPFIAAWIRRHPDYQDLVVGA